MSVQYTPYTVPLLASAVLAAAGGGYVWWTRENRAATWYTLSMAALCAFAGFLAVHVSVTSFQGQLLALVLAEVAGVLAGCCWGVYCIIYTGNGDRVSRTVVAAIGAIGTVGLLVGVTNPAHELLIVDPRVSPWGHWTGFSYEYGPVSYLLALPAYAMMVVGTVLLFRRLFRSRNVYRTITLVLLLGSLTLLLANVLDVAGFSPLYPLTLAPLTFLFWGLVGLLGLVSVRFVRALPANRLVGLFDSDFADLEPLARDLVVEEIDSGIIILDADFHVVDINSRAKELLGADGRVVGRQIQSLIDEDTYLESAEAFADAESAGSQREQLWIVDDEGEECCYDIRVSPIANDDGVTVGRTITIHDVTEQKEREQRLVARERELQTLKQVYSRFLRHNIRNDVTVIQGNADWIREETDGEIADRAESILEKARNISTMSQKTRIVDDVVGTDPDLVTMDVATLVADSLDDVTAQYPSATIRTTIPDGLTVRADTSMHAAVTNAVENAILHNDPDDLVVEIEAIPRDDTVDIVVRDDGSGIPEHELRTLQKGEETALVHSSGIGLWLIDWIVSTSGGEAHFESDDTGATVRMTLPRIAVIDESSDGD